MPARGPEQLGQLPSLVLAGSTWSWQDSHQDMASSVPAPVAFANPTRDNTSPARSIGTLAAMFEPGDTSQRRPPLDRAPADVVRPVARFGLALEQPRGSRSAGSPLSTGLAVVASAALAAALYVWDDLLLAAPIVALASVWGALTAWAVFATVYGAVSFVLALWAVRAYDRLSGGEPGRLARWLSAQSDGRRGQWGRRLVTGGQAIGFVLASFLLGGIVTTWLTRVLRPDRPPVLTAAASCAIFGVTFAAQYAGIAALVL